MQSNGPQIEEQVFSSFSSKPKNLSVPQSHKIVEMNEEPIVQEVDDIFSPNGLNTGYN